jgi:VWFA-related protein
MPVRSKVHGASLAVRFDQATFQCLAASHPKRTREEMMLSNGHKLFLLLVFSWFCVGLSSIQHDSVAQGGVPSNRAAAQQQAQDAREKIRVRSDLVVLSVTVRDQKGNLVFGLSQEDIHVFDDDVEQKIIAFTAEGLPLSLVILVDSDTKSKEGTELAKSLKAVVGGLSVADEAMVCHYDMLFYPGEKFSSVSGDLLDELKDTQAAVTPSPPYIPQPVISAPRTTTGPPPIAAPVYAGSRPSKAMDDALYSSVELLQNRGADRRKVILIISDGLNEPKLNHHTHDEVTESLLRNNVSVYSLAVGADGPKRQFSMLADYAGATGGDIFYAKKSSTMESLYSKISEQARHDYTVAYAPAGNLKDANFHNARVAASAGLTASTRRGYYTTDSKTLEH